jgi:Mitochondrial carrier protein
LLAGSIAGAIGVGIAFPLDTIKTKQQDQAASVAVPLQQLDHSDIDFKVDDTVISKRHLFRDKDNHPYSSPCRQ